MGTRPRTILALVPFAADATIAFYALMAFSAVYLDHHWILDTIVGSAFSVAAVAIAGCVARARRMATP